jgi:multiple sugar transport system ATP-binding protein
VYNRPANKFVAGFIGSPPMNFLPGTVFADKFDLGVLQLGVPSGHPAGRVPEKKVIVGVRPEDIYDAANNPPVPVSEANSFQAKVDVLEKLGAEDTAYLDLRGTPVTATLDPASRIEMGTTAKFAVDLSKIHVFDADTELAIR